MFIPNLVSGFFPSRIQGSKKHWGDPGSESAPLPTTQGEERLKEMTGRELCRVTEGWDVEPLPTTTEIA